MATMTPELYELIIKIVDERVREIRVTREDFDKLTAAVNKLAEAQRRTEERLEQLAEAQRGTEERLTRLESVVEQLAEAQRRTEERLEQLAEAQRGTEESLKRLTVQVGRLSDTVGFGLEDVARVMAPGWFERHLGITVEGELEPVTLSYGGVEVEVNLYGEGRASDGREVVLVGECKSRIYSAEVKSFVRELSTVRKALQEKEIVPFMFGFMVHPSADKEAEQHNIIVLAPYRSRK
ncbi:MAG: hypothetical protein Q6352_020030 [Candidatus Freyrarchaeum guaymaensis]